MLDIKNNSNRLCVQSLEQILDLFMPNVLFVSADYFYIVFITEMAERQELIKCHIDSIDFSSIITFFQRIALFMATLMYGVPY